MPIRRKRRTFIAETNAEGGQNTNIPGFVNDDFADNIEAFIRYTAAANRSKDTLKFYRQQLRHVMRLLELQNVATNLRRLTGDIIVENVIEYSMNVRGNQYSSVAIRLRALRAFLNWAVDRGVIDESPLNGVKINANPAPEIETFSREDLREIFRQPDLETFVGFRDYTIMTLFLETGIRLREITDVKVSDVRMSDRQILIRGKNGESRLVPFQDKAGRVLKRYLKARGESPSEYLIITHDDDKMSRKAVQDRIRKYGRMANITDVRCSPHTFRHTFAKMSVLNGADIFSLQKILGHKTLDMVRVYVNLFSSEVAENHRKFSPVENLF